VDSRFNSIVTALNRFTVFDADDKRIGDFGSGGSNFGQFGKITGITIDEQDRVYTADVKSGALQIWRYDEGKKGWIPIYLLSNETKDGNPQISGPLKVSSYAGGKYAVALESMSKALVFMEILWDKADPLEN
jgi:hypothetical protein